MNESNFTTDLSEVELRAYILGEISDEQVLESIEQNIADDEELFERLTLVEESVIEDHLEGTLSPEQQARFVALISRSGELRQRLAMASALRKASAKEFSDPDQIHNSAPSRFWSGLLLRPSFQFGFSILVAGLAAAAYFLMSSPSSDIAKGLVLLDSAYTDTRFTLGRPSHEFSYSPYVQSRSTNGQNRNETAMAAARALIDSSVKNDPSTREGYLAAAMILAADRRYDDAIAQLETASAQFPDDPEILNDLALIYTERSVFRGLGEDSADLGKALELSDRSIAGGNASAPRLFNRALILSLMKRPDEAAAAWDRYLSLDSSSKWAAEARRLRSELIESR